MTMKMSLSLRANRLRFAAIAGALCLAGCAQNSSDLGGGFIWAQEYRNELVHNPGRSRIYRANRLGFRTLVWPYPRHGTALVDGVLLFSGILSETDPDAQYAPAFFAVVGEDNPVELTNALLRYALEKKAVAEILTREDAYITVSNYEVGKNEAKLHIIRSAGYKTISNSRMSVSIAEIVLSGAELKQVMMEARERSSLKVYGGRFPNVNYWMEP